MGNEMLDLAARMDRQLHLLVSYLKVGRGQNPQGMSGAQMFLMHLLHIKGPSRVSDLSGLLGVTPAAVTGLADTLLAQGLISRRQGTNDRRVVLLDVTPEGHCLLQKMKSERHRRLAGLLESLGDNDARYLIELLEKLAGLAEAGGATSCLMAR